MAILLIVTASVVLAGLIVIPIIEAADAANAVNESRNKGQRGESMSDIIHRLVSFYKEHHKATGQSQ